MQSYTILRPGDGVTVSSFPNAKDARAEHNRHLSIEGPDDVRRAFRPVHNPGDKDSVRLVMKRRFDGARKRGNARGPCLLVIDVDDTITPPEVASDLLLNVGAAHLIYTTHSNTLDDPHYRVVIPVKVETKEDYEALTRAACQVIGAEPAQESWAINSGVFAPVVGRLVIDRLDEPMTWVPAVSPGSSVVVEDAPDRARAGAEALDYARARSALQAIPSDSMSYEDWIQVGMELKSTGDPRAFELWDEWSREDAGRYEGEGPYSTAEKWESLEAEGGRTIASLFRRAVDAGWKPPRSSALEDFAGVETSECQPPGARPIILAADGWPADPDDFLRAMSDRFALVNEGAKPRVYEILQDEARVIGYSERAFVVFLNGFQRPVQVGVNARTGEPQFRMMPMGDHWLKSGLLRRSYHRSTFDPNKKLGPGVFNHWRGWPWAKAIRTHQYDSQVDRFLDHLRSNICAGDEQLYGWLLAWIGQMIQKPGQKPGTACVLRSGQGSGKSLVGLVLSQMVGDYGIQVDDIEMITSGFNAHLRNNIFVFADEVSSGSARADARGKAQKIKSVITGFDRMLQPKGVDAAPQPSFTRLMFSSNELWALLADRDDRRHTVFEVSEKRRNDTAYFGPLFEVARDKGFLRELFCHFRDLDLTVLPNPMRNMVTAGLERQKTESLSGVEKWWHDVLQAGRLPGSERWDRNPATGKVYEAYAASVDKFQRPLSIVTVVPKILEMARAEKRFSRVKGEARATRFEFGTLEECRAAFDAFLGRDPARASDNWEPAVYFEEDE